MRARSSAEYAAAIAALFDFLLSCAASVSKSSEKKACLNACACRSYWWNLKTRVEPKPNDSLRHAEQSHSPAGTAWSGGVRQYMWKPHEHLSHRSIAALSSPEPQTSQTSSPGSGGSYATTSSTSALERTTEPASIWTTSPRRQQELRRRRRRRRRRRPSCRGRACHQAAAR